MLVVSNIPGIFPGKYYEIISMLISLGGRWYGFPQSRTLIQQFGCKSFIGRSSQEAPPDSDSRANAELSGAGSYGQSSLRSLTEYVENTSEVSQRGMTNFQSRLTSLIV